ncbi:MAG: TetR family transcriptional regulator, partial [Tardiphaga sp.]
MAETSTRDLLKTAARRLFAHRGYDGVSVRDI